MIYYVIKHKTKYEFVSGFNPVNMSVTVVTDINQALPFSIPPSSFLRRYDSNNEYEIIQL